MYWKLPVYGERPYRQWKDYPEVEVSYEFVDASHAIGTMA
jgi:hypothetical protein